MTRSPQPMQDVHALVCDMDGTLVDSSTLVPDTFIDVVETLGGPHHDRTEVVALYSLGEPSRMLTHMLGRPASEQDVRTYHERLEANASTPGAVVAYPGISGALQVLAARVRLAVFTGASHRAAQILLGAAGLDTFFDVIVGGDQVARPKPHPDGILAACAALGVVPAAAAYLGDAPTDLEAARRSGTIACAAGWGHLFDPQSPADIVVANPQDLVTWIS